MGEPGKGTSLADRDQMTKLLRFLESDVNIGPGNDTKRRASHPLHGRRSQALPNSTNLPPKQSVLSPPLIGERIQTFYVDQWPPLTVKRGDTVLFSSPWGSKKSSSCNIGGVPISLEHAIELRKVVYGSSLHSFSTDWKKSTLAFNCIDGSFPYGIQTTRCGSRSLTLCVQGFLLKHLIFEREYKSSLLGAGALQPNEFERRRAMVGGMCEMLWQAGDKRRAIVCLKQEDIVFGPDYRYKPDTITEKLLLYEFKILEDLKHFVKRNLDQFQVEQGNGCILFLYSLALSRGLGRIREDMQADHESQAKLLTEMEDASYALINLALCGKATLYIHNGEMLYDKKGLLLDRPVYGVKARSQVGFLFWDKGEDAEKRTEVGSMLKTPKNPLWVTKVNGMYGLLFCLNADLICDWRVENRFTMWYYTGLVTQPKPTVLSLETRIGRARPKTGLARKEEASRTPALENCIMTKWYGAAINWNGTVPFI